MANKYRERFLGTFTPVSGERVRADLQNGAQSYWLYVHARARIVISVAAATAIRNKGSVFALYRKMGLEEDGRDRHIYDGPSLKFITEAHVGSPTTATRLTSVATGTTLLEEGAFVYFTHPLSGAPQEQVYREINPARKLQFFAEQVVNLANHLVEPGGATVVVDQLTLEVYHIMDLRSETVPVFIPVTREIVQDVPSTNSALRLELKLSNYARLIALKQEVLTTTAPAQIEVADIINAFVLRGDVIDIIGPQPSRFDAATFMQEGEASGQVVGNQAYWHKNFQRSGRLASILNPGDDLNLRFELDVQPSATAGSSRVRATIMELERTLPGVLTTPTIPFPV